MMKKYLPKILLQLMVLFIIGNFNHINADVQNLEIGIDEKLGEIVPLDLIFINEEGKEVTIKEVINGKPTILAFVYYSCPSICSPLLAEIASVVKKIDWEPGKEFNILTLSIDEFEDYKLAAEKKVNFLSILKKDIPQSSWAFLTGDSVSIKTFTDAAGFYFKRDGNDFVHSGTLIFLSPEGKITRYLFGIKHLPFDVKMALIEASEGKIGPTIAKVLRFCFSYDPDGKRYVLNLTRIFGAGIVILALIFVVFLHIKPKKKKSK